MFIIQDWASNTLQHNGKFNFGTYGSDLGVPMEFESFDDAWDWLYIKFPDQECFDDYFVIDTRAKDAKERTIWKQ